MKIGLSLLAGLLLLCPFFSFSAGHYLPNQPDSVWLFAYSTDTNGGRNGLHYAWSTDQQNWKSIGPEMRFLFCDYGRWGKEKRLVTPFLMFGPDKMWHCIWSLNEYDGVFAHAASPDLLYWYPQTYPQVISENNVLSPELTVDSHSGQYTVSWLSTAHATQKAYFVTTNDFKTYSDAVEIPFANRLKLAKTITIAGKNETGTIHKISREQIEALLNRQKINTYNDQLWAENTTGDSLRFARISPVSATIAALADQSKKISNHLVGIFFEDINYAADGGLYAELVQNRDFEYTLADKEGRDKTWNHLKCWKTTSADASLRIDSLSPIHPNNAHYAQVTANKGNEGIINEGYDGIPVRSGEKYILSFFVRNTTKKTQQIRVCLVGKDGIKSGEVLVSLTSSNWKKYEATITATQSFSDGQLQLLMQNPGEICLDMVSLFPEKTFRNRRNGLRADLAQLLADIHPRFVRFPGGCVAHGDGLGNIYRWKNTIGPLEARKPQRNLWNYHQSAGLGYFEYFQFCEDIGAEPLPVVAAGVPCQNSAVGGAGQQGGIPICDMEHYVQDILDLIEWANGDVHSKWGKLRAEAGHPKPFDLKYIGIGNEDLINDIFEERFALIYKAVKARYPEVTVIGTVGPAFEGTDYTEGWKIATKLGVPMVDEHYYQSPGWFIYNQDFYDKYDRSKSKVYLGEYASHLPGRPNNVETALSEALYLTALERNGDVVHMASYAPLLAREGHTQWNPNLIYFNNSEAKPTVDYYIQQLFGQNAGDTYFPCSLTLSVNNEKAVRRVASSLVRDHNGDFILKLVNMLPAAVDTHIDLSSLGEFLPTAKRSLLTGKPTDKNAHPVTDSITVSPAFSYSMPAYSFSVVRLQPGNRKGM